jgi:hypothetical protein
MMSSGEVVIESDGQQSEVANSVVKVRDKHCREHQSAAGHEAVSLCQRITRMISCNKMMSLWVYSSGETLCCNNFET